MSQPQKDAAIPLADDGEMLAQTYGLGTLARLRRNLWLVLLAASGFFVGPPVTRLLESYRGVVLERQEDSTRMYLAFEDRLGRWVPLAEAPLGAVVEKERGEWNAKRVDTKARDFRLVQLFERYTSEYEAVIARIDPPVSANQPSIAVIDTTAGKRLRIPLAAEQLAAAAVGRRLHKLPGSWDPSLVEAVENSPVPATLQGKP